MDKTLVVWRRLGKEHGEKQGFRVNSEDTIKKHIEDKINKFKNMLDNKREWFKVSDDLIIEKPHGNDGYDNDSTIYYFINKNWAIVKNMKSNSLDKKWKWFIHIGKMKFNDNYNCWIWTDWFSDVIVNEDNNGHSILDLDELGKGLEMGLINKDEAVEILSSTQELIDLIRNNKFPPEEIKNY